MVLARWMLSLTLMLGAALLMANGAARAATEQELLVLQAETTLSNFLRDPEMSWLQQNIHRAKAILIAPEVVKAGFIVGGSGGNGVLLARAAKGDRWNGPVFYTVATASVGFQAGVSVSEMITLVMTDRGLSSLQQPNFTLGGDVSVAAGPIGAGKKADVQSDFISFSRAKGIYGGLNLDGTSISAKDDWNQAYYGKPATPADILAGKKGYRNPQAEPLRRAVTQAARRM
ncbi:MAG TPA: lipid-binding SYLF domain-containing protein [Candidatus Competibacteraceae bacterium]|nr:lipid-binding SYLF domain-containing protein [Candidatus Competibacteraceae bacterium]